MFKNVFWMALLGACLTTTSASLAQQAARPVPTAAELKKNLAVVEAGTEESLGNLIGKTNRQLVAFLKAHELSAAAAKNLGLELSAESNDASYLKVFTYYFDSGGTRGTVHRFVLQWKNAAGQLFAYGPAEESEFTEIYKLASPGRTQYLLLGGDKGDSNCFFNQAYVIELKGNYLLTDVAAFGQKSSLGLCNVEMKFDTRQQVLRLDLSDYEAIIDDEMRLTERGYRRKPGTKSLNLKLSSGRFIQNP